MGKHEPCDSGRKPTGKHTLHAKLLDDEILYAQLVALIAIWRNVSELFGVVRVMPVR
jgi:hypothetical protein